MAENEKQWVCLYVHILQSSPCMYGAHAACTLFQFTSAIHAEVRRLRGYGAEREAAPQPRAVEATVCVEVLRACGLAAGVREAAAWLGGGKRSGT